MPRRTVKEHVQAEDSIVNDVRLDPITTTGSAVDCRFIDHVTVRLHVGNSGGTATLDVHIEESADGSTGWSDVTGAVFTQKVTSTDDSTTFEGHLDMKFRQPYLRAIGTVGQTTNDFFVYSVEILGITEEPPVTRSITAEWDIVG